MTISTVVYPRGLILPNPYHTSSLKMEHDCSARRTKLRQYPGFQVGSKRTREHRTSCACFSSAAAAPATLELVASLFLAPAPPREEELGASDSHLKNKPSLVFLDFSPDVDLLASEPLSSSVYRYAWTLECEHGTG